MDVVISRRILLTGVGALVTSGTVGVSKACSIAARQRPIGFSDAECRRSLQRLISLINEAATLSDEQASARLDGLAVNFDETVSDPLLTNPDRRSIENLDVIRAFGSSAGTKDRSPIRAREVNLLKGERGIALYQFTLRRDQYHPEITQEDAEGGDTCLVAQVAYFGWEEKSYLGVFRNNNLRDVSAFDEWLLQL